MSAVRLAYPIPASCRVFKSGSSYIAQNIQGEILSTSTTDASIPINAAINNIPGAAARGWGGRVFIHAGDYDCKTVIDVDRTITGYSAIELEGEGKATRLNFTPSSALTNAIRLNVSRPRLAHMRVYGNANVTNLVRVLGYGTGARNDYGILEGLQLDGTIATDDGVAGTPTSGQKGIFMDWASGTAAYFCKINKVDFRGLDIGLYCYDAATTATQIDSVSSVRCNTGIKLSGGQHNISNCWFQGNTDVGQYGIHLLNEGPLGGSGSQTRISNINVELAKTATESAAVCIEKGVVNCSTSGIGNASATTLRYSYIILDKNTRTVNNHQDQIARRVGRPGYGWWELGLQPWGKEGGAFQGSILESPASTFTTLRTSNGAAKSLFTTSTTNNISSMYYNKHDGYLQRNTSNWRRDNSPNLKCRFLPLSPTAMRMFIGLWDAFAAPTSSADILNAKSGFGLWLDTAVSPNWKIMHNDGTGASTVAQIGAGLAAGVDYTSIEIITDNTNSTMTLNLVSDAHPWTSTTATTDIPASSSILGWLISLETLASPSGAKTLWLFHLDQLIT